MVDIEKDDYKSTLWVSPLQCEPKPKDVDPDAIRIMCGYTDSKYCFLKLSQHYIWQIL